MSKQTNTTSSHGVISVIGRRRYMEDAVAIVPNFVDKEITSYDYFAVYDGCMVAKMCKERLHHVVAEQLLLAGVDHCWKSVMATSFARMDGELRVEHGAIISDTADMEEMVEPTALVVLVGKEEIVVTNNGNSRVVLYSDGAALPLSRDQKARADAKQRMEAEGRTVTGNGYLEPFVINAPEVIVHKRSTSDNFLVIASNGLWDVVSNEMACDIVQNCCSDGLVSGQVLEGVTGNCTSISAAMLVELALARGSKDNISVIVVKLQQLNIHANSNCSCT